MESVEVGKREEGETRMLRSRRELVGGMPLECMERELPYGARGKGRREYKSFIGEKESRGEEEEVIKMGCVNARGVWDKTEEIVSLVVEEALDIIGITETHIREEQDGSWKELWSDIEYEVEGVSRGGSDKAGGGVLVAWSKRVKGKVWHKTRTDTSKAWVDKERIWLLVDGDQGGLAICTVYIGCEGRANVNWNDNLYEELYEEVGFMKSLGRRVLLMGDFNGWIGCDGKGISGNDPRINENGNRLLGF